jgi:hypothetical protein
MSYGMTLRDYIAIQLMPGLLARRTDQRAGDAVEWAYTIADVMIKMRAK